MEQKNQDMTSGSLAKGILFFSIPLMLSNILQVLFNMSDIAVVGHFAGAMALGSVGSTTILVTMFTGFLIGLSGGINVLVEGDRPLRGDFKPDHRCDPAPHWSWIFQKYPGTVKDERGTAGRSSTVYPPLFLRTSGVSFV